MSLQVSDLSKSYFQGQEKLDILKNLNFVVNTSEVVAVVGASGSGKSTFLSLIAGLDHFDSGDIKINGQSLKALDKNQMTQFRAAQIGFIFQQFHLVSHLTAYENLILPLEILGQEIDENKVASLFRSVGLSHREKHKPSEMSGGECQRLAIARGLITSPKLLLADEPSGNLDRETGHKVMNLFFEQVKATQTTTVLVTHDLDLAKRCDRLFTLEQGQLIERH